MAITSWGNPARRQRLSREAVAGSQGEPERTARLLGAAALLPESRGISLPPIERADLDRVMAGVRAALGEAAFAAAWAEGRALPLDQAVAAARQAAPAA